MLQVLLVDDEYMIVQGLKKLIPFEKLGMEVALGAYSAQEALDFVATHPVDIVITDVSMPGMTGLDMIEQMKDSCPQASYIVLSGYREFDYVKSAMSLQVVDYLLKPVNKDELMAILERIEKEKRQLDTVASDVLSQPQARQDLLLENGSEEAWRDFLREKKEVWIGASQEVEGFATASVQVLGQHLHLILMEEPKQTAYTMQLRNPYPQSLELYKKNLEKMLFYGQIKANSPSAFEYYHSLYQLVRKGQVQEIMQELPAFKKRLRSHTPDVGATKHLIIQLMMDIYHLFDVMDADAISAVVSDMEKSTTLDQLMAVLQDELDQFIDHYQLSDHVQKVLDMIENDYQRDLTIKDVSERLYINPVYLGQLIKRETGASFSELLNKKRIQIAGHLLLNSKESIEGICYAVGFSNVGYFYKVFRKFTGKSPKAYRKQLERNSL